MISVEERIWIVKRAIESRKFLGMPFEDLEKMKSDLNDERKNKRKK